LVRRAGYKTGRVIISLRILRLLVKLSILTAAYRAHRCIGKRIFRLYCARVNSEMVESPPDIFSYGHKIVASFRTNVDGGDNFVL